MASVCIPPSIAKHCKKLCGGKVKICTVIGFPLGYHTTEAKVFEVKDAIENGADEIDMVINLGDVKDGNFPAVTSEIKKLKEVCGGKILKVIVETCYLTPEEKKGSVNVSRKPARIISRLPPDSARRGRRRMTLRFLRKISVPM
jgi:deoxyribose-phosphate aldolase